MALNVNGSNIPNIYNIIVNGTQITRVQMNTGVVVWEKSGGTTINASAMRVRLGATTGAGSLITGQTAAIQIGSEQNTNNALIFFFPGVLPSTAKNVRVTLYRSDSNGATDAGFGSFCRGGVAFNESGLGTTLNSTSANYSAFSLPNGVGDVTFTVPTAAVSQMLSNPQTYNSVQGSTLGVSLKYRSVYMEFKTAHQIVLSYDP